MFLFSFRIPFRYEYIHKNRFEKSRNAETLSRLYMNVFYSSMESIRLINSNALFVSFYSSIESNRLINSTALFVNCSFSWLKSALVIALGWYLFLAKMRILWFDWFQRPKGCGFWAFVSGHRSCGVWGSLRVGWRQLRYKLLIHRGAQWRF